MTTIILCVLLTVIILMYKKITDVVGHIGETSYTSSSIDAITFSLELLVVVLRT